MLQNHPQHNDYKNKSYKRQAVTQLSGFRTREMNNPLALCELAARDPNISAGHMVKQA